MALFILIVFEIFVLLLSLKNSFAEEPHVVKTTTSVLLEDFQKKVRLLHKVTEKQLDQSGFIKIRKNVWYRTVLWQGSYAGPAPFFVLKDHAVVVREKIEKPLGKPELVMSFSMPASVELSRTTDGHYLVRHLLRENIFGAYSSVGDFIADSEAHEILTNFNDTLHTKAKEDKKNNPKIYLHGTLLPAC